MSEEIGIFGLGPVGARDGVDPRARGEARSGSPQRSAPKTWPAGAAFVRCDALDADVVRAAVAGLRQVVLAIGLPYVGALWREAWPRAMTNFVEACAADGRAPRLRRQSLYVRAADGAAQPRRRR